MLISELIEKIQRSVYLCKGLEEKEKMDYLVRLEALGRFESDHMEKALTILLKQVEKDPGQIKDFFVGINQAAATFQNKGVAGLVDEMKKVGQKDGEE